MARDLGSATLGLASETGFPLIDGADTALLQFPAFGNAQALRISPKTGSDEPITSWAVGFDVYIPQPSETFVSLLQTGDGDGDLFLRDNGDGTAGIGIDGVYEGAVPFDAWTRIVVTFTQEDGATILRTYVDGILVGTQDLGATSRWDIDPETGLKLFNDNDGETAAGAVSAVFFSAEVPSADEVAGLLATIPTPDAGGFFPAQPSSTAVEVNFDNADVSPSYGDAEISIDGFGFQTPEVINESAIGFASQFGIEGPGGSDVPVLNYDAYGANEGVLVGVPPVVGDLSSYTMVWDVNFDTLSGFQALLQTDVSQSGDGELFVRSDGGIGINSDYDGTVTTGTWHRIAITVEDQGDGTAILSKYLDGVFLDSQIVSADRFTLDAATGFLLMSDNDGETSTGYLSHFGLSAEVLDAAAIAELGGPDGEGPFEEQTGGETPADTSVERTLTLSFDSSFRPYADQTGEVMVSFDGGEFTSLLTLDASTSGGNSSLDRIDETVTLDILVPAGVEDISFRFEYIDADNDWWWAIDNIALTEDGTVLYAENFDGLADSLQPAVDENIADTTLGWTDTPPEGWTRENDPNMPQGTTEWQGWSFATPEFWTAADQQSREAFSKGTGVIAIADGDEWDDFNTGSVEGNDFNSSLTTPEISLTTVPSGPQTFQLGFDDYQPTSEFGFQVVEVIDEAPAEAFQNNINDLLLVDDGTPVDIDLLAAFGEGASNFVVTSSDGTIVDAQIDGTTLTLSGVALGHSDITVTALAADGDTLTENFRAIVAGENAYVFAILPDTQDYTSNAGISDTFANMTEWLVDHKTSLGIEHVIHVGDIVQFGASSQWDIAEDAMERLDGEITYTLAVGNHDQQRPGFGSAFSFESDIDSYFTPEQVGATAEQGGGTYDGFDVGDDTFGNGNTYEGSIRNSYTTIETPDGTKWLILSLEFGMPDDVLRWASEVVEDHLDHRVIIVTHGWNGGDGRITPVTEGLTTDNDGWGYAISENPRSVNGGEDAWREFASKYPNVTFTFNGHNFMGGAETVVSYGPSADPVFQMFVNYQNGAWSGVPEVGTNGGNGAIRLVVIDPDNDRVTTHTKLVETDTYYDEFPDHEEVFENVELGDPAEIAIAKAGPTEVITGDGISASVSLDPIGTIGDTTGAVFEWFTADGEKLGETDGAPLEVDLQTGTNRLVLKVTDQNGAVSTDEKTVIVEAPDAYLTETFDDGDLAGWVTPSIGADAFFDLGTDLSFSLPSIGGLEQIPVQLQFDSSFRPYDNQIGEVMVSFDDGETFSSLLTLDADTLGGNSVLDRANETVTLNVLVPSSADSVQFAWRLSDADNDWWWAIDNIQVTAEDGDVVLLFEDFDDLPLQNTVDEGDPGRAVWTPTPPEGWDQEVADTMSQGSTEFQGWTFMEKEFWIDTAENQSRDSFTLGVGNVAIADPDEWDDANEGAAGDTDEFDSSLKTPLIDISAIGGGQAAGDVAGVLRVPALDGDEGLLLTPTLSTGTIDTYSFIFDILLTETTQSFSALFQTDLTNSDDAEIYFRNDGETASIGILGDYDGALEFGEWGRLALVVETDENGQQTLYKYLDGVFLDSQIVDTDVSDGSRWSIDADAGLLLFAEPNGFTSESYTNALYFTEEALDADTIAALGGVDVDGPVDAASHTNDFQLNFDGALDTLDYGSATLAPLNLAGPGDTSYLVKGSIYGNPDGEGEAALYQQSNGADELLLWGGEGAEGWSDYVFDIVFEPADNDTVGAVFYYQDENNFYRLTMDQQLDIRTLIKVEDGVETVLATETASYRHFAMQDLRIAVMGGVITITLDDEMLFDGPVTDQTPLSGGTIGLYTQSMDRVLFDNISVNPITLAARALTPEPADRWAVDLDGDGVATLTLSAEASLSNAGIATYEWLIDGTVIATGERPEIDLAAGETTLVLRVTDAKGAVSEDQITVHVAANGSILVADDFEDGDLAGWTIVDEGTIGGPSDWKVVNGALVQASDIQSSQQGTGSAAYSTEGDGPYILRDGTYALWDDPDALDWTDYSFSVTLTPNDDDGIGVLFRYSDPENYYKLEADAQTGLVMLTRHLEGRETILARGYIDYTPGEPQDWRIEVEDGNIRTYIDGKAVFGTPVEDRTLPSGTVGLYGWGSENLTFDDVTVVELGSDLPADPGLEIALIDADTGERIATLEEGDTQILASSIAGRSLTIAAFLQEESAYFGQVESMRFDLNDGAVKRVDNDAPFALFRDVDRGRDGLFNEGENAILIDLYSRNFGGGELLESVGRSFTVVDDIAPDTSDLRVSLIDAKTNEEIAEITDGGEIGMSQLEGRRVTIAAFIEDSFDFEVESMSMTLNERVQRTDNVEPYSLFGDKASVDPVDYYGRVGLLDEGLNTMVFELYSENWLFGDQLGAISFDFTVVDDLT